MKAIPIKEIQSWLKDDKTRTRAWLADQCRVSKSTVDGWFGGRPINSSAMSIIADLIRVPDILNPKILLQTFMRARELADAAKVDLDAWIENLMEKEIHAQGKGPKPKPLEPLPQISSITYPTSRGITLNDEPNQKPLKRSGI